jgi:hypothetical protein
MKRLSLGLLLITLSFGTSAATDIALSMVPRGRLVETIGRDFIIKTRAGTKIGIEFSRDGKFKEAKGVNLNQGDELEPGDGLLSLGSVAQILQKAGLRPQGFWMLENDKKMGWIYEFQEKTIDATSGQILK